MEPKFKCFVQTLSQNALHLDEVRSRISKEDGLALTMAAKKALLFNKKHHGPAGILQGYSDYTGLKLLSLMTPP